MGATLTVKERRLIEATLTFTGEKGLPYGFLANRTIGMVGWADLTRPEECPSYRWLLPDIKGKVVSELHDAEAEIRVLPHPVEELSLLGELKVEGASVGWAGITIVGAQPLMD
jgi:hypothetical protein